MKVETNNRLYYESACSQFDQVSDHARRAAEVHAARAITAGWVNPDDHEDLVQDALLGLWRQLPRYDPARSSPRTFVEQVVQSKIKSSVRNRRTIKRRFTAPLTELEDPARFNEAIEYQADVQRAFDRLSPYDRMVATMLVDMTPAEAARSLRIARSTIYVAIARIRDVFVEVGVYPTGYLAPAARKINVASPRTLLPAAAYVVNSQHHSGKQIPSDGTPTAKRTPPWVA